MCLAEFTQQLKSCCMLRKQTAFSHITSAYRMGFYVIRVLINDSPYSIHFTELHGIGKG